MDNNQFAGCSGACQDGRPCRCVADIYAPEPDPAFDATQSVLLCLVVLCLVAALTVLWSLLR